MHAQVNMSNIIVWAMISCLTNMQVHTIVQNESTVVHLGGEATPGLTLKQRPTGSDIYTRDIAIH